MPNRMALAPLTNTQSNTDGTLHENEYRWLVQRAGYFGLVSTCAAYVSTQGKAWDGQLGISSEIHLQGLQTLAKGIKSKGSVAMIQLHHGGRKASMASRKISSSSGIGYAAAGKEDIEEVISQYVSAAKRASLVGFDGVEIHGANGYLFTQFLSDVENNRDDEYGGSIKARSKLLRETVQAVRSSVDEGFMVNVRISPVGMYERSGIHLDDSIKVAQWLAHDGVDVLHLSLRDASGPPPLDKFGRSVVEVMREEVPRSMKICSAGGIVTRELGEKALNKGSDLVAIGKAAIRYHDWPMRSKFPRFVPSPPPWSEGTLKEEGVSSKFYQYLKGFAGLVEGGKPSRKML